MKTRKLLWGVFFIAAAVLVVVNQLGYLAGINLWSMLLTVMLVPVVFSGIYRRNFFNLFFGAAFLLIIYAQPLGITALVPWTVLAAALFLSIGFSILIPGKHNFSHHVSRYDRMWREHSHEHQEYETVDHIEGNEVNCSVSMGGSCKYLHSDSLERGYLKCSLGYLKVYFDHVSLHPDGASVQVDCSLGSMELFIPRNWNVILNIEMTLGNVDEEPRTQNPGGPTLTIAGDIQLANVSIRYI